MIRTTWKRPHPYGAPFATDSASTIAAPLLAGFSITLIAGGVLGFQQWKAY